MSETTVDEMALAHVRLSQSLRSLSTSDAAYRATTQALVDLSDAIRTRVATEENR